MSVMTVNLTACESFLLISHPYIIAKKIQQLLAFCADIGRLVTLRIQYLELVFVELGQAHFN